MINPASLAELASQTESRRASVAFALITFYPYWYPGPLKDIKNIDKIRGDLALEFIIKAKSQGHHVIVVDGKSFNSFHEALGNIPGITVLRRESDAMIPAKRLAYRAAARISEVRVIVASEPEKVSLLDSIERLIKPIQEEKADVVVPRRNPVLFRETYPNFQYASESKGNVLYNQKLRDAKLLAKESEDLDIFFGPRIFRNTPEVLRILSDQRLETSTSFEGFALPVAIALAKRLRVQSVEVPFRYPQIQKENELVCRVLFEKKRRIQRRILLTELTHFLATLH